MSTGPIFLAGPAGRVGEAPAPVRGPAPPALFCDRDGTIIPNRDDYVRQAAHVTPLPGAVEALRRATAAGFTLIVISNQSPVGRGILSAQQAIGLHRLLLRQLAGAGVPVSGSYLCPHAPADNCRCRKPRPGMIESALAGHRLDPFTSYLVGDAVEDMLAAHAAGVEGLLVRTGRGTAHAGLVTAHADLDRVTIVPDLGSAVAEILTRHATRDRARAAGLRSSLPGRRSGDGS